jgi:hypothetical protein
LLISLLLLPLLFFPLLLVSLLLFLLRINLTKRCLRRQRDKRKAQREYGYRPGFSDCDSNRCDKALRKGLLKGEDHRRDRLHSHASAPLSKRILRNNVNMRGRLVKKCRTGGHGFSRAEKIP